MRTMVIGLDRWSSMSRASSARTCGPSSSRAARPGPRRPRLAPSSGTSPGPRHHDPGDLGLDPARQRRLDAVDQRRPRTGEPRASSAASRRRCARRRRPASPSRHRDRRTAGPTPSRTIAPTPGRADRWTRHCAAWIDRRASSPVPARSRCGTTPARRRSKPVTDRIRVVVDGLTIADSTAAFRVLETSQPPAFYLPPADIDLDRLEPTLTRTFCEWKGQATYWTRGHRSPGGRRRRRGATRGPTPRFEAITDHLAFYAQKADECWVGDDLVRRRTRAASTAGGSPTASSARSRAVPAPPGGEPGRPVPASTGDAPDWAHAHPGPVGLRGHRVPLLARRPVPPVPADPRGRRRAPRGRRRRRPPGRCSSPSPDYIAMVGDLATARPCLDELARQGSHRRAPRRRPHRLPDVVAGRPRRRRGRRRRRLTPTGLGAAGISGSRRRSRSRRRTGRGASAGSSSCRCGWPAPPCVGAAGALGAGRRGARGAAGSRASTPGEAPARARAGAAAAGAPGTAARRAGCPTVKNASATSSGTSPYQLPLAQVARDPRVVADVGVGPGAVGEPVGRRPSGSVRSTGRCRARAREPPAAAATAAAGPREAAAPHRCRLRRPRRERLAARCSAALAIGPRRRHEARRGRTSVGDQDRDRGRRRLRRLGRGSVGSPIECPRLIAAQRRPGTYRRPALRR